MGEWAESIPSGAILLLAVIDRKAQNANKLMSALGEGGISCPSASLPQGCVVAAAIGRKGETHWDFHMAAPDVVLVTVPTRKLNVACQTDADKAHGSESPPAA